MLSLSALLLGVLVLGLVLGWASLTRKALASSPSTPRTLITFNEERRAFEALGERLHQERVRGEARRRAALEELSGRAVGEESAV